MRPTRRDTLALALAASGATADHAQARPAGASCASGPEPARWAAGIEGQRRADLGNGTFLNPVLAGDHPDPNVFKDGDTYYATFSSFEYYPGVPIWRSHDLVNWTPLTAAVKTVIGSIWALDIAKHGGRYFIYIPALDASDPKRGLKIYAITADRMEGPWSEPVDMRIDGYIDPGHAVGEDGRRYLFLNGGHRVRISDDGLSAAGPVEHVYDGWPIPPDWVVEGFALEGPKVLRRDGWFYLFSGEGGTAGPPTSHMVVVARSRSIDGPWENCPYNPIVHTASRDEPWWSRGHGTPVEGPDGRWWLVYHGYENGFRTLGRQMLLEPIAWSADGWPRALGGDLSRPLPKPGGGGSSRPAGMALSGFTPDMWGVRFKAFAPKPGYLDRARVSPSGELAVSGQGRGPADASPLLFIAGDRSYEVRVEVEIEGEAQGGLVLFYDPRLFCGLGVSEGKLHAYRIGQEERWPPGGPIDARRLHIRLVNQENVVTFLHGRDGVHWTKERSYEVAGYNHNVADGFLSLRPGLYAAGEGRVVFRSFSYRDLPPADGLGRVSLVTERA